jgi:hypothetical protein
MANACNSTSWEMEIMGQDQPGQKVSKIPSEQTNIVAHPCNPDYVGGIGRGITVKGQSG